MFSVVSGQSVDGALRDAFRMQERAVAWLNRRIVPVIAFPLTRRRLYRLPYALASSGETSQAEAVFQQFVALELTSDGDLQPGRLRERFTDRWASYPLSVLAAGATAVGETEKAQTILDTLANRFVDHEWGGALGERPEVRVTRRQDLFPTAQFGLVALKAGHHGLQDLATRWFTHLLHQQSAENNTIIVSTEGGELIWFDPHRPGEAGSRLSLDQPKQPVASLGIGAAFLAGAATETGDALLLRRAQDLYRLYSRLDPDMYQPHQSAQVGKRAWGACALLRATGDASYLHDVIDMVGWFERGFVDDGHWRAPQHLRNGGLEETPLELDAEITVEFLQHISLVIDTLVSGKDRHS